MLETFSQTGILKERLFKVEGDLVENYNRALETVVGKRTQLSAFHIDKRGRSPEIEEELGEQYLQAGPANRYCIVVSPDQKDAGLIHEEFSFDNEVLGFIYANYLPVISLATRVDGMYGELDDDVREYETLEDLLLIKKVDLELHTPSGFLTKARELQKYARQLQVQPELLIKDDSAVPKQILELVREVGDVRNYNLSRVRTLKELSTFFSRLFSGVFVFRDVEGETTIKVRRPGRTSQMTDESSESSQPEGTLSKSVVIYYEKDYHPEDGPTVKFIPLQDKHKVIEFLVGNSYADYSYDLLEPRLSRLEDETFLSKGHAVIAIGREQRAKLLHDCRDNMFFEWYELKDLKRNISKGHKFGDIVKNLSIPAQCMLLTSAQYDVSTTCVVEHLLTKLYRQDYEKMYFYNRHDLELIYEGADENKRKYIAHVLPSL